MGEVWSQKPPFPRPQQSVTNGFPKAPCPGAFHNTSILPQKRAGIPGEAHPTQGGGLLAMGTQSSHFGAEGLGRLPRIWDQESQDQEERKLRRAHLCDGQALTPGAGHKATTFCIGGIRRGMDDRGGLSHSIV